MTRDELFKRIAAGEDSSLQFKEDVRIADSLAAEMAAFANGDGGTLLLGVTDYGDPVGLDFEAVARVNQLISNAASQHVRSPLSVRTENVSISGSRVVIVLEVPKGQDKPYFDLKGVIWVKCGADKRRINSKEELRRLFQLSGQFHADELPSKAGVDRLDRLRFRDFLADAYGMDYPKDDASLLSLLRNMDLAGEKHHLNLAGVLLFAERPEWIVPEFVIKAVRYPGKDIHASDYLDTEDITGVLPKMYDDALAFIMRNLHKLQGAGGVNAPGVPEIPPVAVEELLVNALIHRDYLISAPIRLFIFDDRIEIISPGHLPNNLTVERICSGISNIRNPILVSYAAKGLLPYKGLGSGIKRALAAWPGISFEDDREKMQFVVKMDRKSDAEGVNGGSEGVRECSGGVNDENEGANSRRDLKSIRQFIALNPGLRAPKIAKELDISVKTLERKLKRLRETGRVSFHGASKNGGYFIED